MITFSFFSAKALSVANQMEGEYELKICSLFENREEWLFFSYSNVLFNRYGIALWYNLGDKGALALD